MGSESPQYTLITEGYEVVGVLCTEHEKMFPAYEDGCPECLADAKVQRESAWSWLWGVLLSYLPFRKKASHGEMA